MTKLTPHEERCVAVRAGCDPRTVRAYIRNLDLPPGERRQDSTVAARIADAIRAEGFCAVQRAESAPPPPSRAA